MRRISDSSDSPVAHWDVALDRIDTEVLSYVTSICDLCLGTSTTPTRDDIQKKPIGIAKLTVIYRLDFELGNAEDGETPAVEAGRGSGSFGVLSLVSRRIASATFSPTLAGTLLLRPATAQHIPPAGVRTLYLGSRSHVSP